MLASLSTPLFLGNITVGPLYSGSYVTANIQWDLSIQGVYVTANIQWDLSIQGVYVTANIQWDLSSPSVSD